MKKSTFNIFTHEIGLEEKGGELILTNPTGMREDFYEEVFAQIDAVLRKARIRVSVKMPDKRYVFEDGGNGNLGEVEELVLQTLTNIENNPEQLYKTTHIELGKDSSDKPIGIDIIRRYGNVGVKASEGSSISSKEFLNVADRVHKAILETGISNLKIDQIDGKNHNYLVDSGHGERLEANIIKAVKEAKRDWDKIKDQPVEKLWAADKKPPEMSGTFVEAQDKKLAKAVSDAFDYEAAEQWLMNQKNPDTWRTELSALVEKAVLAARAKERADAKIPGAGNS